MKMVKVIDLLNKIANGEEVPYRIKYDGEIYEYNFEVKDYEYSDKVGWLMDISRDNGNEFLNDEVEIIEEDKNIEELNVEQDGSTYYIRNEYGTKCYLTKHSYLIAYKVNELIREINKLKGKNKYE